MGQGLSNFYSQTFFLPIPTFTEHELPDQTGKVIIITGGYTGIGLELANLLYQKHATVYLAGRSQAKASAAITTLEKKFPYSKGRVEHLHLDLADLSTIKTSVEEFERKEKRLDVLVNNAGVMTPPASSKSKQGFELQMATNVYGHFLFTKLLLPLLRSTAKSSHPGSVRVSWAASIGIDVAAPTGSVIFHDDGSVKEMDSMLGYGMSKCADVMLAVEGARRWGKDGILVNSFNPGNLASELDRHSSYAQVLFMKMIRYPVHMGAWTEFFAGWSPEITMEKNGCYIIPWGRIGSYNSGLQHAIKSKEEGGEGKAEKLWEACEKVCAPFL